MATSPRNIVLCLDGTWNNPYQTRERDDGTSVLKPSNVLKMARSVPATDPASGTDQITYYDAGVGSLGRYPGISNRVLSRTDSVLGGAWGAGFEANIEEAVTFLVNNYIEGDRVFLFGFSRGAAQARGLTRFLDWMGGIPSKHDAYFVPLFFQTYVRSRGEADPTSVTTGRGHRPSDPPVPITIDLLGVWDTVMALGSRLLAGRFGVGGSRAFHVDTQPANCVSHARQALATDERRYDFEPSIWGRAAEGQSLEQRWFPGVHSNVGGGYDDDGLANVTFRWFLREAESLGLVTDGDFTKFYRPYPQDRLYRSETRLYRVTEFLRGRGGRGKRTLQGHPASAGLTLDPAIVHRMRADPGDHPEMDAPYRPDKVIEFLATLDDLSGYLASLGLDGDSAVLPPDVLQRIERSRGS